MNIIFKLLLVYFLLLFGLLKLFTKIFMSLNYFKLVICLVLLASTANCINLFGLNMLNTTNGARCMDGSAPGIYLYQPDPNDTTPVNKLMIFF